MNDKQELAARFDAILEHGRQMLLMTVQDVCNRAVAELRLNTLKAQEQRRDLDRMQRMLDDLRQR